MKYVLAILLFCAQFNALAQKDSLTLYAYEQKVIPGISPARDIEEQGRVIRKPSETKTQYLIYLIVPNDISIYPESLWIKGKQFGVKVKEAATPVKHLSTNDSTITPLQEERQRTFRLFPIPHPSGKEQRGAALAKQKELVLVYKLKGQYHFIAQEKVQQLNAVNLQ